MRPIQSLVEPDVSRGGLAPAKARELLRDAYQQGAAPAGCVAAGDTGSAGKDADSLIDALFAVEPLEWARIGAFQDVTMRLLAERLLPGCRTYLQGELAFETVKLSPPRHGRRFHAFVSPFNSVDGGVRQLLVELHAHQPQLELTVTEDEAALGEAEHFLLYLDSATWTSADADGLARQVGMAMRLGVHLLLAHEMPMRGALSATAGGVHDRTPPMRGVEFSSFFSSTPKRLLRSWIYAEVATPLKGGVLRPTSMALLAMALAADPANGYEAGEAAPASAVRDELRDCGWRRPLRILWQLRKKRRAADEVTAAQEAGTLEADAKTVSPSNVSAPPRGDVSSPLVAPISSRQWCTQWLSALGGKQTQGRVRTRPIDVELFRERCSSA